MHFQHIYGRKNIRTGWAGNLKQSMVAEQNKKLILWELIHKGAAHDVGPPMTYAQMKIPEDQTEDLIRADDPPATWINDKKG